MWNKINEVRWTSIFKNLNMTMEFAFAFILFRRAQECRYPLWKTVWYVVIFFPNSKIEHLRQSNSVTYIRGQMISLGWGGKFTTVRLALSSHPQKRRNYQYDISRIKSSKLVWWMEIFFSPERMLFPLAKIWKL